MSGAGVLCGCCGQFIDQCGGCTTGWQNNDYGVIICTGEGLIASPAHSIAYGGGTFPDDVTNPQGGVVVLSYTFDPEDPPGVYTYFDTEDMIQPRFEIDGSGSEGFSVDGNWQFPCSSVAFTNYGVYLSADTSSVFHPPEEDDPDRDWHFTPDITFDAMGGLPRYVAQGSASESSDGSFVASIGWLHSYLPGAEAYARGGTYTKKTWLKNVYYSLGGGGAMDLGYASSSAESYVAADPTGRYYFYSETEEQSDCPSSPITVDDSIGSAGGTMTLTPSSMMAANPMCAKCWPVIRVEITYPHWNYTTHAQEDDTLDIVMVRGGSSYFDQGTCVWVGEGATLKRMGPALWHFLAPEAATHDFSTLIKCGTSSTCFENLQAISAAVEFASDGSTIATPGGDFGRAVSVTVTEVAREDWPEDYVPEECCTGCYQFGASESLPGFCTGSLKLRFNNDQPGDSYTGTFTASIDVNGSTVASGITIPADGSLVTTGVSVAFGDIVEVTATGTIENTTDGWTADPDGYASGTEPETNYESLPCKVLIPYSLVGTIT